MTDFTEDHVEWAALAWLESVGWRIVNGPEIAPGEPDAERESHEQIVLERRLRDALARNNPSLPSEGSTTPCANFSAPRASNQSGGTGTCTACWWTA